MMCYDAHILLMLNNNEPHHNDIMFVFMSQNCGLETLVMDSSAFKRVSTNENPLNSFYLNALMCIRNSGHSMLNHNMKKNYSDLFSRRRNNFIFLFYQKHYCKY